MLHKLTDTKVDEPTLVKIMDTFDLNMYGEIAATDLIKGFETAHKGLFD